MNKDLIQKILSGYLLFFGSLFLSGCSTIDEDANKCLFMTLKYEYHMGTTEVTEADFLGLIDYVDLYIFDESLRLIDQIRVGSPNIIDGHLITLPASYLGKTMVAWAREMRGSYTISPVKIGDHIDLLTLKLNASNHCSSRELADLFYGGRQVIALYDDNLEYVVNFLRNDKRINLSMLAREDESLDMSLYDVKITAHNGHYGSDNKIIPDSPMITYSPMVSTTTRAGSASCEVVNMHTLRLKRSYINDVLLTITDKQTGSPIQFDGEPSLKLVEFILKSKPSSMGEQEYLDREEKWDVEFALSNDKQMAVSVTINGWTTWLTNTDL